ncbi:MAG: flavodoxin family protein [Dehalococcoidales bacterium]|nr:flavodoxin family protein [Dehalococcoidales bacterium]
MKTLIIYDSAHGNTEEIAGAIAGALPGDVKVVRPAEVAPADLESLDLLVIGAPTYGGQPSPPVRSCLKTLTRDVVNGVRFAAFDTRISAKWVGIFGYAAGKIAKRLMKLGGQLAVPPEGFFVLGMEGPLKTGEAERAAAWGETLVGSDSQAD